MLVTQLRRGQRISVGASALTSGRLEAFAWHPLRASSAGVQNCRFHSGQGGTRNDKDSSLDGVGSGFPAARSP